MTYGRALVWTTSIVSPRHRPADVLYLDFDGVLHPEDVGGGPGVEPRLAPELAREHRLFEHAELLVELLVPYPDVRIVLSTTWVRIKGYRGAVRRLPPGLAARCCGATWHTQMRPLVVLWNEMGRGTQVLADVQRRQPKRWLALDDDAEGWAPFESHLVVTDPWHGLSLPRVREEFEAKLAGTFAQGGR
jgi:hypothetical protein